MPDREKVIKGLRCHVYGHPHTRCHKCPYWGTGPHGASECNDLAADAFALLNALMKEQEPRVMTIGDLYGEDMGYYERKDEELVWPALIARGGPDEDETVGIVRKDAFEIKADCGLMNITWRIWTAYPTMAQREAVKWE